MTQANLGLQGTRYQKKAEGQKSQHLYQNSNILFTFMIQFKLIYGPFWKSNMNCTQDVHPRPDRKKIYATQEKLIVYCPKIYTIPKTFNFYFCFLLSLTFLKKKVSKTAFNDCKNCFLSFILFHSVFVNLSLNFHYLAFIKQVNGLILI